ncbi:hypothetical protein [Sphingomonas sp. Leaf257]|jgi:hypothetical protein|uniref:hypothetical protein n=1 Tax=Sphingomonas sp. Leaf257 TaxID=1736309 RepID=UPI0007003131|nr:hypothetical protein [Sphingomonas sp. Leaf257]KQO58407.1 hypothetical protein ASF14_00095 [Sphingomonas sp. Leaf257]
MSQTEIRPDGKLHLFGTKAGIKKVKEKGVKVAVPQDVPFMVITEAAGLFLTHGPVGGSKVPYQLIEWAYRNAPAFGVSIEPTNGINMPVIWLPSHHAAKRAVASLNGASLASTGTQ